MTDFLLIVQKESRSLSHWDFVLGWEYIVTNEFVPILCRVPADKNIPCQLTAWRAEDSVQTRQTTSMCLLFTGSTFWEFCSYYFYAVGQLVQGWLCFSNTITRAWIPCSLPSVHSVDPWLNVRVTMTTLGWETELEREKKKKMSERKRGHPEANNGLKDTGLTALKMGSPQTKKLFSAWG